MSYLFLIIVTLALGFGTQAYINSQYKKWSRTAISSGMTGAQAARAMLDANGLYNISIEQVKGKLTDHYDPRAKVLRLSYDVYNTQSVAATAIACHEAGHAVQDAKKYAPARIRGALVPAVNFASNIWMILLFIGIFLNIMGCIYLAIGLYAIAVLFQLVTLPVEFDASRRAVASIESYGYLPAQELDGTRAVLRAAALTYVAAALTSIMQLLYFIGMARD